MTVNEQQIWLVREQLPGGHQRGSFTKGEKTGNVGHGGGDTRHLVFDQFKRGILQQNHCGSRHFATLLKPNVRPADQIRRIVLQTILADH